MKLACLFGHSWEILKEENYIDISYSDDGWDMTRVYKKCKNCPARERDLIMGHWEDV